MDGRTDLDQALIKAAEREDIEEIRGLLRPAKTANIAVPDERGDTILHEAAWTGKTSVVRVLTETDRWEEIVNLKGFLGWTALHNCCAEGHTETIELLLEKGANVVVTDEAGWTPLHHAAHGGHLAAVGLLLKYQKDLDHKTNSSGGTALHIAAQNGFARIVSKLIESRADPNATAWDGKTVLHWALDDAMMAEEEHPGNDQAPPEAYDTDSDDENIEFSDDDSTDQRPENPGPDESVEDEQGRFDEVFKHILKGKKKAERWSALLKVAHREESMHALQYLMNKMYLPSDAKRLEKPLRRIWLAMSEARSEELMEMLWKEMPEYIRNREENRERWNILSLATSLGKFKTVYWLLRSRRWSKSDIEKAQNLSDLDWQTRRVELSKDSKIWKTPFVHDERSGIDGYRRPEKPPDDEEFGATITDFYEVEKQIVSICYDCDPWSLIKNGPKETMKKSMASLKKKRFGWTEPDEYPEASCAVIGETTHRTDTVITSTTHRLDRNEDPMFQGFLKRLCQSQTTFYREATPSSVDGFAKLIASFYINALNNLKLSLEVPSQQDAGNNAKESGGEDQDHRPSNATGATESYRASLRKIFADSIERNVSSLK
ncbi:hypothetical protein SLS55_000016 [Diplodia seriata]|uniref:Ankyrin repeat protein n=1 Tax=Diplodia seriata TaxID=420778 RepID=A0ABR3CT41_9PEZI